MGAPTAQTQLQEVTDSEDEEEEKKDEGKEGDEPKIEEFDGKKLKSMTKEGATNGEDQSECSEGQCLVDLEKKHSELVGFPSEFYIELYMGKSEGEEMTDSEVCRHSSNLMKKCLEMFVEIAEKKDGYKKF